MPPGKTRPFLPSWRVIKAETFPGNTQQCKLLLGISFAPSYMVASRYVTLGSTKMIEKLGQIRMKNPNRYEYKSSEGVTVPAMHGQQLVMLFKF